MAGLQDTLPRKQLMDRFGPRLTFEEYGKSHLSVLAKKIPVELHGLGATVWNRIVTKRWHQVDPCQFAPYFHTKSPDLHLAISKLLKIEVIRDIYYVKGWRGPKKRSNLVLELLVAWLYRNDLHLGDITFINPDRPIPKANRKHELQTHEGLGLLPVLLENMHLKAKELGCNQQTLTAAMTENVALFRRFGFDVEDSEFTRLALELGFGIPMEKDL